MKLERSSGRDYVSVLKLDVIERLFKIFEEQSFDQYYEGKLLVFFLRLIFVDMVEVYIKLQWIMF